MSPLVCVHLAWHATRQQLVLLFWAAYMRWKLKGSVSVPPGRSCCSFTQCQAGGAAQVYRQRHDLRLAISWGCSSVEADSPAPTINFVLQAAAEAPQLYICMLIELLRRWGGAGATPAAFFEACDALGLLVWAEFPITGDCNGRGATQACSCPSACHLMRCRAAASTYMPLERAPAVCVQHSCMLSCLQCRILCLAQHSFDVHVR